MITTSASTRRFPGSSGAGRGVSALLELPAPETRFQTVTRAASLLRLVGVSFVASVLVACGGGADTERLQPNNVPPPRDYTGPAAQNADVQAFMDALWINVRNGGVAGCGGCHGDSQNPRFARNDDVNLAYQQASQLINSTDTSQSRLVTKVGGGHNCWLGSNAAANQACATTMQTWVDNWLSGTATGGTKKIQLQPPPLKNVGATKNFPAAPDGYESTVYPVVRQYCAGCHNSSSATKQSPFFADDDVVSAYAAVRSKIDLDDPANSRLVLRLRDEFHNCWTNCSSNADTMQAAIEAFAGQIPTTQVDPSLVISRALTMYDGTVASGGNRYESSQIGLWEFKEGTGLTAFDTSGVEPAINLTLSPEVTWVGGWGIDIKVGKAQGSTAASKKLHDMITATGQYTIEAWAAPGNVNQEDTRIVTYSAGPTLRNFTMGQTLYAYDFYNRTSTGDANGQPLLQTADADEDAQATLQHVVMTYDQINGRRIYVNGQDTQDADPSAGGSLGDWDDTFAFVLGNEPSNDRQWKGVLKMVAVHNRALSPAQVQQNFDAGVGEKFFLLFDVSAHVGSPGSYVMFEVSQFDSYGYLFNRPTFISLTSTFVPDDIPLKGMRIGANGAEFPVGQAYRNMDTRLDADAPYNYTADTGQVLSSLGTVVPLEKGPDADEFFLTFEVLGTSTNVVTEPTPLVPPPPPDGAPKPDIGVKVFDEISETMSQITGVSPTQPNVKATYASVRQSLPAVEGIETFLASHQTAIAQLAIEYCNALVEDTTLRAQVFPGFNFNAPANTAFDTTGERDLIFNPLLTRALNTNVASQPDSDSEVRPELDNLIDRLTTCGGGCASDRTKTVVKSVCSAVIGSGAALLQ